MCKKKEHSTSVCPREQLTPVAGAFVPLRKTTTNVANTRPIAVTAETPKLSCSQRRKHNLALRDQQATHMDTNASAKRQRSVQELNTALEGNWRNNRDYYQKEPMDQGYAGPSFYCDSASSHSRDYDYSYMAVDYSNSNNSNNNNNTNNNNNKNKKNNSNDQNPINKTVLDSYSYISFVNSDILSELDWIPIAAKDPIKGHGINGKI
jgi:hypothetical protein